MNRNNLHYLLMLGYNYSNRAITLQTGKWELLPGQPKILEFLREHNGCTQKEISKGCVLDKSTVTSLLSRMEVMELITRKVPQNDRRHLLVYLTEKGLQWAKRTQATCDQVDACAWRGISEQEQEVFLETFQKVLNNLEQLEDTK